MFASCGEPSKQDLVDAQRLQNKKCCGLDCGASWVNGQVGGWANGLMGGWAFEGGVTLDLPLGPGGVCLTGSSKFLSERTLPVLMNLQCSLQYCSTKNRSEHPSRKDCGENPLTRDLMLRCAGATDGIAS